MSILSEPQHRGAMLYATLLRAAIAEAGGDMGMVDLFVIAKAAEAQMTAEELAGVRALMDRPPDMEIVNRWLVDAGALPSTIEELRLQ